ncbi:MAG: hypothetical protein ABFS86_16965 [Planctomycetota bacterium]
MIRRFLALTILGLLCIASGANAGGLKVALVDGLDATQGTAVIKLEKGALKLKATLEPVPAPIDTGDEIFTATMYRAYLASSTDAAIEVSLGAVYPTTKGVAVLKAKFKGDLSQLGLDRIVLVAFSKDGLHSHDVLTGTIELPQSE